MGCINSTKKMSELKFKGNNAENVFRIRVVRLLNDSSMMKNGFLELSPQELIFTSFGRDPIVWSLRHLRRYGLNCDIFSFEAGRRCKTGPGIYVFRCQQAESFYQLFQSHVNTVTCADGNILQAAFRQSTLPDMNQYTNDYLHPIPFAANVSTNNRQEQQSLGSVSGEHLTSVPSHTTNETVDYNNQAPNILQNSNLYQEYTVKPNEHNKVIAIPTIMDKPPDDSAPKNLRVPVSNTKHMYENIESVKSSISKNAGSEALLIERYENFSRVDLPVVVRLPTDSNKDKGEVNGINYIVLDLDNTKTPSQSANTHLEDDVTSLLIPNIYDQDVVTSEQKSCFSEEKETCIQSINAVGSPTESLGYSTIDFIKTCALLKSSTYGTDFDQEELRITRHSKCVKKSYSICE